MSGDGEREPSKRVTRAPVSIGEEPDSPPYVRRQSLGKVVAKAVDNALEQLTAAGVSGVLLISNAPYQELLQQRKREAMGHAAYGPGLAEFVTHVSGIAPVKKEHIVHICDSFEEHCLHEEPFTLGSSQYVVTTVTPRGYYARSLDLSGGGGGALLLRTQKHISIAIYRHPTQQQSAVVAFEKAADKFVSANY